MIEQTRPDLARISRALSTAPDLRERRRLVLGCATTALVCFAISWIGSAPQHLTGLHWDTGSYLARIATSSQPWRHIGTPWTSHLALPQLYIAACALAAALGGSCFVGFRVLQSLCFAGAGVLFFATSWRLCRSSLLAALFTLCFATAWGILVLVFAMVDNLLYLPAALAVLYVCVARVDRWRDRDSLIAGALAGAASLLSLQCVLYVVPPLLVAALLGGPRSLPTRVRQVAITAVVFVSMFPLWGLVLAATTDTSAQQIFGALLARPKASFVPTDLHGVRALFDAKQFFHHLGMGVAQELTSGAAADALYSRFPDVGAWLLALELCAVAASIAAYLRKRVDGRLPLMTSTLLAFTLIVSLYHDLLGEKYKRYEFLPIFLFLISAAVVGVVRHRHRAVLPVAIVVGALVVGLQAAGGIAINRQWHASLPFFARPLDNYYGRDNLSWLGYFEKLDREHSSACRFVFAVDEFPAIRWNHEVTAGLTTQLPAFAMVGSRNQIAKWKYKPSLIAPGAMDAVRECDSISPAARIRLASRW